MLDLTLRNLALDIHRSGIPEEQILRTAGMCTRHLNKVRRGDFELTKKAEKRIRLAITRMKRIKAAGHVDDEERAPAPQGVQVNYRLALALIEAQGGVPAQDVLVQDPGKRATADPDWMKAAGARRIALYIVNQYCNVTQAELGRAVGMTKSAVHLAIREITEMRDQAEVARFLHVLDGAFQK